MLATRSSVTWYRDKFGWLRKLKATTQRLKPFQNDSMLHCNINSSESDQYEFESVHSALKWVQNSFKVVLKLVINCPNGFKVTQKSSKMAQKLFKMLRKLSKKTRFDQNYSNCVWSHPNLCKICTWGSVVQNDSIFAQNGSDLIQNDLRFFNNELKKCPRRVQLGQDGPKHSHNDSDYVQKWLNIVKHYSQFGQSGAKRIHNGLKPVYKWLNIDSTTKLLTICTYWAKICQKWLKIHLKWLKYISKMAENHPKLAKTFSKMTVEK